MSCSFYEGFASIQPTEATKKIGTWGVAAKKGCTYEVTGAKVVESASRQLSPDMSNMNKESHEKHEKESGKQIRNSQAIIDFYNDIRATRDPKNSSREKHAYRMPTALCMIACIIPNARHNWQ